MSGNSSVGSPTASPQASQHTVGTHAFDQNTLLPAASEVNASDSTLQQVQNVAAASSTATSTSSSVTAATSTVSSLADSLQLLRHLPRTIDFDKSDYPGWAQQMSSLLDAVGVWDEVDPDTPPTILETTPTSALVSEKERRDKRKVAFLLLSTALKDAESRLVLASTTKGDARALWMQLRQRYQDLPPAALASLLAQLLQARQDRNESVQQFSDRISLMAQRLRNNGENAGEKEMRLALLQGLHEPIASVVRSYYNSNRNAKLSELVVIANGEEAHIASSRDRHASSSSSRSANGSAALSVNAAINNTIVCHHCQQPGHKRRECPQLLKDRGQHRGTNTASEEEKQAGRCPLAGHRGHMKVDCRALKKAGATGPGASASASANKASVVSLGVVTINKVESTSQPQVKAASSSTTVPICMGAVLDSGAAATVVPRFVELLNTSPAEDVIITVANGAALTRPTRGTAVLPAGKHTLHVRNALQHSDVDRPLLSVSSLLKDTTKAAHVTFLNDTAAAFTPAGELLLTATLVNGIYVVDTEIKQHEDNIRRFAGYMQQCSKALLNTLVQPIGSADVQGASADQRDTPSTSSSESELGLLHQRLCHRSWSGIQQLAKSGAVVGLELVTGSAARLMQDHRCNGCAKAKAHRQPFGQQLSSLLAPKQVLGLVVADVAGPLPIPSLSGARYFLLILDVFTQHLSVIFLKDKAQAASEVKAWCRAAAVRHQHAVIHFHTDGGGEFVTRSLRDWFKKKGTQVTDTPAHTPQHNGKVERLNRTIIEWASACLIHAGASKRFWAHAVATAVFVRNHSQLCNVNVQGATASAAEAALTAEAATSTSTLRTPQAVWFSESSALSLSHLRVWGCDADVHYTVAPGHKLPKLTDKSRLCMFLGYDPSKNNIWCFYNPSAQRVFTSRDAVFHEQQFTVAHALKVQEQSADDGYESEDDEQWLTRVALDGEIRLAQKISAEEAAAAPVHAPTHRLQPPTSSNSRIGGGGDASSEDESASEAEEVVNSSPSDDSDASSSEDDDRASPAVIDAPPAPAVVTQPLRRSTRVRQPTHFYGKVNGNLAQARAVYINSILLMCDIHKTIEVAGRRRISSASVSPSLSVALANTVSGMDPADQVKVFLSSSTSTTARIFIPRTFAEAWEIPEWRSAILSEYGAHDKNGTWVIVPLPPGRKAIGWKLVFRVKLKADGTIERFKARLTAKGFAQLFGIEYNDTFAPTLGYITLRVFFAVVAAEDLELYHIDVETAFLNAKVEEEIYMQVPTGINAPPGYVCKLNKALYGIKQAPHAWHAEIAHTLTARLHYIASTEDCCLFIKRTRSGGRILFPLFVDDAFPACTAVDEPELLEDIEILKSIYTIKHTQQVELVLGMRLQRNRAARTLHLDQQLYVERLLSDAGFSECRPAATPTLITSPEQMDAAAVEAEAKAATNDAQQVTVTAVAASVSANDSSCSESDTVVSASSYAALVGSLQYAAIATRPDIAYAVNVAARGLQTPTAAYRVAVERILRYLKGTSAVGLTFGGPIDKRSLIAYTDANWAGDSVSDGRSTSGFLARIGSAAVCWRSKKQSLAAQSSMESEYIAASDSCREVLWLRRLLCDMIGIDINVTSAAASIASLLPPTPLACDSASAISFINHRRINARNKHINVRACLLRENIAAGHIVIRKVSTHQQLADIMTKPLPPQTFLRLMPAVMGKQMDVIVEQ